MAGQETIPATDGHSRAVRRGWTQRLPGIRGIAARKRAEEELRLLHALTRAIAEAQDLHSALGVTLGLVCETTGWNYGEAWIPPPDGGAMEYSPAWYGSTKGLEGFRDRSAPFKFPLGVGLPGRAWASKRPEWIPDVSTQPLTTFLRAQIAREAGLKAAISIPIVADGEVLAVLCFFMFESREEDKRFVELVSTVAMQLGSLVQRKRAGEALRESEERYRTLVETARDVIYTLSTDGAITSLNRAFETTTGWSRAEWLGKPFASLPHPDDLPRAVQNYQRALRGEVPPVLEARIRSRSGEYLTAEIAARPLLQDGEVVGTLGIARDITERRRAEEALRDSEERYRLLVETVNAIPWEVELDTWRFTYVGPQAVKLLGYPLEDWYGEAFWADHVHPEDREQAVGFCREATARSEDHQFEYRMLAADGRTVWLGDIVSVVLGEGGPKMLRGIMVDISERKRAEEALREAREELEGKVERQLLRRNPYGLTFRELTVLHLAAEGKSDKEIGAILGISPLTAQKHVANILCKMGAASRTEASVRAVREGLLD